MAERIKVEYAFLEYVRSDMSMTADQVNSLQGQPVSIPEAAEVSAAYQQFLQRWDARKKEIADALNKLDENLQKVSETFQQTDDQLASGVQS